MLQRPSENPHDGQPGFGSAERDIVALGIAAAALILFVGTGGSLMPKIVRAWLGVGAAPDLALTNAVLLNIALVIFGWRRYSDLQREVKERRRAEALAQELASIDSLTGCLNRRTGVPAIEAILEDAPLKERAVAILMMDLDNFKQINDVNGHKMGDAVLAEIARRAAELMPADGVLARVGGDEFVFALPYEPDSRDVIDRFVKQLIRSVSAPIEAGEFYVEATVSIGIADSAAVAGAAPTDCDTLIHRADMAMYHAKKHGRNRSYWFEAKMESDLRLRAEREAGIRRGIAAREFVPYYEQQIDLETGDLVGFEMLARWKSPQFGLVKPELFIPVAEDIDVICELSELLVSQALRDAKEWHPRLTLSVNISPVQLRDPWFAQKLLKQLVDAGFPPNRFEIEITESCLHQNVAAVRSIITSLKNQGIRISLDDFGTGYSSMSQLRSLPFDRLKIDRSFVNELAEGVGSELVEAIVSLGRGLSLPVTAEGVETAAIREALRGMGELKGQGYLYGEPEDAAATLKRLARMNLLADSGSADNEVVKDPAAPLRKTG